MNDISQAFGEDHKLCDDAFAAAEEAALGGRWPEAATRLDKFLSQMETHLSVEEGALFPAFEAATGMTAGPTAVMRMEHEQMRSLFEGLRGAVRDRNADAFSGVGQTLLILLQQHNMKEEHMLYPMCDRELADRALIERLVSSLRAAS